MRIEINAGGLKGMISVAQFGNEYSKLIDRNKDVVDAFKSVQSKVNNLSGGVGNLQSAYDQVTERLTQTEQKRVQKLENSGQKFSMFIVDAMRVDRQVAEHIRGENKQFYNDNPWAVPPKPKSFWDKVKGFFKKVGKAIKSAVTKAVNWVVDKVKKAWNATVKFIKQHWKTILKVVGGAVLIAGLFALSVVTGGAAAGVFALAAKAALTAALTSTATSVVSGIVQGKSAGEIFDSAGDSFFKGSVTGAISGAVGAVGPAVLSATGSQFFAKGAEILAKGAGDFIGGMITEGTDYLCKNGTLSGFFSGYAKDAGLNVLKGMAGDAVGAVGGYLKEKGVDLLTSTFKGLGGGTLVNSFMDNIKAAAAKAPSWLIGDDGVFSKVSDISKLTDPGGLIKEIGEKAIGNAFGGKLADVSSIITDGLSNISQTLDLKGLATSGLTSIADKIGISNIGDKLSNWGSEAISSVSNSMVTIGKDALSKICGSSFKATIGGSISSSFDFKNGLKGSISGKVSLGSFNLGVSFGF